jgi:hypothetical protein
MHVRLAALSTKFNPDAALAPGFSARGLEFGHFPQPMWDIGGELVIVFNSEINDHTNVAHMPSGPAGGRFVYPIARARRHDEFGSPWKSIEAAPRHDGSSAVSAAFHGSRSCLSGSVQRGAILVRERRGRFHRSHFR